MFETEKINDLTSEQFKVLLSMMSKMNQDIADAASSATTSDSTKALQGKHTVRITAN